MPKFRSQLLQTATGAVLFGVGALVLAGWWAHVITLVQLSRGSVAMVPNTACAFVLLGISLLNVDPRVSRVCAAAVVALATLILAQYIFSVDLHIDQLLANAWVNDPNPYPGRMAPQTTLCFIASGIAVLLPHTGYGTHADSLRQVLTLLVGAIGIVSLIGYSLELELLYSWYRYTRMALHTAACFTLLGVTLWLSWYAEGSRAGEFDAHEDHRVTVICSALIVLVAAIGGSSGFILLAAETERASRAGLTQALDHRMGLVQSELRERRNDVHTIATALLAQGALQAQPPLRDLLRGDITAISVHRGDGTAATAGSFVRNPELTLRLASDMQLLWHDGATLHIERLDRGARVVIETRWPALSQVIADTRNLSVTGDLRICAALDRERMRCLPTRLVPRAVANTERQRHGSPLAMSKALDGERGTLVFRNYRDHQAIGAYSPLANTTLAFVLQQDTEDLYAPLRQRLQALALVLGLLIVVSVFMLRSQIGPLVRRTITASAAAAAAATRTTAIMNSVPDGIITIDEHGVIVAVNPALSNMFGYAEHELLGQPLHILIPAEIQAAHEAGMRRFMREGTARLVGRGSIEVPARRRDGTRFTAQLALTEMCLGDKRFVVGNMRDVTVAKFAEAQTRRMNERLKLATQAARIGVWEWDLPSNVMIWDARMHELYGHPVGTPITNERWHALVHPEDIEALDRCINEAFVGLDDFECMFRIVLGDGTERTVKAAAIIARDAQRKPLRVTGVNWDVTESTRLERMKSEFVSVVSHELRTPITSIRGALGLIAGNAAGALPDKVQHLLEIAYRNTDRLALLVSDILDIEKIESGGMTFDRDNLDVRELVAQAVEANQAYAGTREVQLQLVTTSSSAFVMADAHRLLQVMANLLSNAAKFSPAGSRVEINVTLAAEHVRVSVRDHGPGIPDSFKARVFQKFSQADSSDSRAKGGSGLGLAISKAIIERLGGSIGYVCDNGVGTTFYFELPLAEAHSMTTPRMQSAG
ncbi:MAG: ATP-binding protein [Steroidobacteraceae bacterium]